MNKFFKKTLSFLGLSDEDEISLDDEEKRDIVSRRGKKLKVEDNKLEKEQEKGFFKRGHSMTPKPARKVSLLSSGREGIKSRVFVAEPGEFEEIQIIADNFKENIPVIINLQKADQDLAKRVIDFCSGLTYALEGSIKKVAEKVFLITPYNVEVSSEEKELLREEGFYNNF
jgi:cell division inhibitor SepF